MSRPDEGDDRNAVGRRGRLNGDRAWSAKVVGVVFFGRDFCADIDHAVRAGQAPPSQSMVNPRSHWVDGA